MHNKFSIFGELAHFFRVHKRWWLAPLVVLLVIFAFFLVFAQTSVFAPFIYTFI